MKHRKFDLINRVPKVLLVYAFLFAILINASAQQEYIQHFQSDITVHKDASMTVQETITVNSQAKTIRHGIVREFPTRYKDKWGNYYNVGFTINNILLDGSTVPFKVVNVANGKKIYIGDPDSYLKPGVYTYMIEYVTTRQLGFFENHDELYWNVTGNGWRLPIQQASAQVHVPTEIPSKQIEAEAYTGPQGAREQNYTFTIQNHVVIFETTKSLEKFHGLTIVVNWPKGYITQPSIFKEWLWFLLDNIHVLIFILGLLTLIIFFGIIWYQRRKMALSLPIIPLFYPPDNMSPGAVRYFVKMGYDERVLASDIVNMAIQNWLTIEYVPGWFGAGTYTLKKKEKQVSKTHLYHTIFDLLFSTSDTIRLKKRDNTLEKVMSSVNQHYTQLLGKYFNQNAHIIWAGIGMVFFIAGIIWWMPPQLFLFIAILVYSLVITIAYYALKGYTPEGQKIENQITGFTLFLSTTETERLKIIGTPPTKTPELYETYLPFAIALGVEQAWSKQFAPLFKKLEQEGRAYSPIWYTGYAGRFDAHSFSVQIGRNFSNIISSSTTVPGRSSGTGGRGSSGGGGGGGGGGGW